jgi:hypothetical protein
MRVGNNKEGNGHRKVERPPRGKARRCLALAVCSERSPFMRRGNEWKGGLNMAREVKNTRGQQVSTRAAHL